MGLQQQQEYNDDEDVATLAATIIYMAEQRCAAKGSQYKNVNSAIVAVCLEADQILMDYMKDQK